MIVLYFQLQLGAALHFCQPEAKDDTVREIQPTFYYAQPRDWSRLRDILQQRLPPSDILTSLPEQEKRDVQLKVLATEGLGCCKVALTGSASIHQNVMEFFEAIGLPLVDGIGLTEASGPLTSTAVCREQRPGSLGKPYPGMEIKISDPNERGEGEICFRGRNRMSGYLNKREETASVIDDEGWCRTGDMGRLDEDGFLYWYGRIKEFINLNRWFKIAPVPIEDRIKRHLPFLSNVIVVGEDRPHLSCLLTIKCVTNGEESTDDIDPVALSLIAGLGSSATTVSQVINDPVIFSAIQSGIDTANEEGIYEEYKVKSWHVLPVDFSTVGGELGRSEKVRRFYITKKYADVIDSMY